MSMNPRLLRGELGEFGLIDVLQMMGMGRKTGALHVQQATGREGLIYFNAGVITYSANLASDSLRLGDVLQQLRMVNRSEFEHAYREQMLDPFGKRLGDILVGRGIITPQQLKQALRAQVLWTVRELAEWQEGSYQFQPHLRLPTGEQPVDLDVTQAVMESVQWGDEFQVLRQVIPEGVLTPIRMNPDPPPIPLTFPASTWYLISKLSGINTVRGLAVGMRQPELEVAQAVVSLIKKKVLLIVMVKLRATARFSTDAFDFGGLLGGMEHNWLKKRNSTERLQLLAEFVNATVSSLLDFYQQINIALPTDLLQRTLEREHLEVAGDYRLKITSNHLDTNDILHYYRQIAQRTRSASNLDRTQQIRTHYLQLASVLKQILRFLLAAINARVSSPIERVQNEDIWEALFHLLDTEDTEFYT